MSLFRYQPFLRLLIALIIGIYFSELISISRYIQQTIFSCLFLCGITYILWYRLWFRIYSLRWLSGTLLFLFFLNVGILLSITNRPSEVITSFNIHAHGKVLSLEERNNNWIRMVFQPEKVNVSEAFVIGDKWMIMVRGPFDDQVQIGNKVSITGELLPLTNPTNPYAFDYGQYLRRNRFSAQMFSEADDVIRLKSAHGFSPSIMAQKVREHSMLLFVRSGLEPDAVAIINALLLGDRAGVDREVNERFIRSGAVHILAVSGLHVGILYLMLNYILSFFFKSVHPARFFISVSLLATYAFITGFSPSVSRAVLMFAILQAGKLFQRDVNMYNLLCASATLLLLINPMFLFHAGFWLSHLAVAGIVAFYPVINGMIAFRFIVWRWIWSIISVSLAAQITTFPFSIYTFGAFPFYFLLANIFILPVVAPVLILSFVVLVFSFVPFVATIAGGALNALLIFMVDMVAFIESIPGSYSSDLWISLPLLIALYLVILFSYQLYLLPSARKWIYMSASVLMVVFYLNIQVISKVNSNYLAVYDVGRSWMVDFVGRGEVLNLKSPEMDATSAAYARDALMRRISVRNHNKCMVFDNINDANLPLNLINVELAGVSHLIVIGQFDRNSEITGMHDVDVVILAANILGEPQRLFDCITFKKVVVTGAVPYWTVERLREYLEEREVVLYDIRKQGAYLAKY